MALQQAQMLLSMNSLEAANAGAQQNNTESFAVALCHLAELHAEQVGREHAPPCLFFGAPEKHWSGDRSGWLRVAERAQWAGCGVRKARWTWAPFWHRRRE